MARRRSRALERHDVTLVLSDLRMPKLDGIGLLARDPPALARHGGGHDHRRRRREGRRERAGHRARWTTSPSRSTSRRSAPASRRRSRSGGSSLENRGYQERLQEKVALQARRLEELFLASVQSLAEALEVKDPYTRGHSVRVSHYCAS